jgi:hypothetical protein
MHCNSTPFKAMRRSSRTEFQSRIVQLVSTLLVYVSFGSGGLKQYNKPKANLNENKPGRKAKEDPKIKTKPLKNTNTHTLCLLLTRYFNWFIASASKDTCLVSSFSKCRLQSSASSITPNRGPYTPRTSPDAAGLTQSRHVGCLDNHSTAQCFPSTGGHMASSIPDVRPVTPTARYRCSIRIPALLNRKWTLFWFILLFDILTIRYWFVIWVLGVLSMFRGRKSVCVFNVCRVGSLCLVFVLSMLIGCMVVFCLSERRQIGREVRCSLCSSCATQSNKR